MQQPPTPAFESYSATPRHDPRPLVTSTAPSSATAASESPTFSRGADCSEFDCADACGADGGLAFGESIGLTTVSPRRPPSVAAGSMRSSAAASSRWSGSA
ncbi:hypothetical protein ACFQFH_13515 [Halobaculum halobium]|uniref:hypothetical protein n=1 Tax=Halobaculum halobium TaxID=3032281 RepID=UPI00361F9453